MISANFIPRFYIRLRNLYGLDARALSLMRVAIALVLLLDLCIRSSSLTEHYTELGVLPFNALELSFWKAGYFSLFQFCDTYTFALIVFILTGIVYFFLLVGYKTRLFTLLSWFLLTSLQNRNTLVLQGGDDLLRLILFLGIFLPWGNFYSIDSRMLRQAQHDKKIKVLSVATLGYVILLFSVYFFTGLLKSGAEWNSEGTALYYALSLDQMTWPLGKMLLSYTRILKILTVVVRWFEMLAPFLLFIPFKNAKFRLLFIIGVALLQIGISLTMFVGLFYLIALVILIGLLPVDLMDWFDGKIKRKERISLREQSKSLLSKISSNYYFNVIKNSFLCFCIALCMLWNIGTVSGSGLAVSDSFFTFGYGLRFNQNWGMFAPTVFKDDGWYVMEGIAKDSLHIDINRNGSQADYTKPASVLAYIKDDRWRKYYENYLFTYNDFIRPYLCTYLIKDWNTNHPDEEIISLQIIYMKEVSVLPNQKQQVTKEILCTCRK